MINALATRPGAFDGTKREERVPPDERGRREHESCGVRAQVPSAWIERQGRRLLWIGDFERTGRSQETRHMVA